MAGVRGIVALTFALLLPVTGQAATVQVSGDPGTNGVAGLSQPPADHPTDGTAGGDGQAAHAVASAAADDSNFANASGGQGGNGGDGGSSTVEPATAPFLPSSDGMDPGMGLDFAIVATPEPSAAALLGLGALVALGVSRRRA
jgi:hypothetical protein